MRFLSEKEKMRYRAAEALGLKDKLLQVGWAGLTAAESGKIGGWISAENRRATLRGRYSPTHPPMGRCPLDPPMGLSAPNPDQEAEPPGPAVWEVH